MPGKPAFMRFSGLFVFFGEIKQPEQEIFVKHRDFVIFLIFSCILEKIGQSIGQCKMPVLLVNTGIAENLVNFGMKFPEPEAGKSGKLEDALYRQLQFSSFLWD